MSEKQIQVNVTGKDQVFCQNCNGHIWAQAYMAFQPKVPIIGQSPIVAQSAGLFCAKCGPEFKVENCGGKKMEKEGKKE